MRNGYKEKPDGNLAWQGDPWSRTEETNRNGGKDPPAKESEKEMSRFDYVKYDEKAIGKQEIAKSKITDVESFIELNCQSPRAKALALTKLEEVYMWIGKAIRDDQLSRNGSAEIQK